MGNDDLLQEIQQMDDFIKQGGGVDSPLRVRGH